MRDFSIYIPPKPMSSRYPFSPFRLKGSFLIDNSSQTGDIHLILAPSQVFLKCHMGGRAPFALLQLVNVHLSAMSR